MRAKFKQLWMGSKLHLWRYPEQTSLEFLSIHLSKHIPELGWMENCWCSPTSCCPFMWKQFWTSPTVRCLSAGIWGAVLKHVRNLPFMWVGTLTFEEYLFCRQRKAIRRGMIKQHPVIAEWCTVFSLISPHFRCASRQCSHFCDWSDPETADSLQNTNSGCQTPAERKRTACAWECT